MLMLTSYVQDVTHVQPRGQINNKYHEERFRRLTHAEQIRLDPPI